MSQLESIDVPIGTKMPKFILKDPEGSHSCQQLRFREKRIIGCFYM